MLSCWVSEVDGASAFIDELDCQSASDEHLTEMVSEERTLLTSSSSIVSLIASTLSCQSNVADYVRGVVKELVVSPDRAFFVAGRHVTTYGCRRMPRWQPCAAEHSVGPIGSPQLPVRLHA